MICIKDKEIEQLAFEALLNQLVLALQQEANNNPHTYQALGGSKLERKVYEVLCYLSQNTRFEDTIELVSGQAFPDIIAKDYYGIEVKTTKSDQWKSVGSSIAEGTRIDGIEKIYLLFGKLSKVVEFRCRPYEECLSAVVVTHSPRYLIDMNLEKGHTFFDKIAIPYNVLRKQEKPIDIVINYYRSQLKPGETTWWASSNNQSKESQMMIKLWNNLSKEEATALIIKGFCLFPEILSNKQDKFQRLVLWLSVEQGVLVSNIRDKYTAGGKVNWIIEDKYYQLPQIIYRLLSNILSIKESLIHLREEELLEYWNIDDISDRWDIWKKLIVEQYQGDIPLELLISSY